MLGHLDLVLKRKAILLNLSALAHAIPIFSKSNYLITDLISPNYQGELISQFPSIPFFEMKKDVSHTDTSRLLTFQFLTTHPINKKNLSPVAFSPTWYRFIQNLTQDEYIFWLSKLVGIDLTSTHWQLEFACYRNGHWLDAHYDQQKNKILTQLFYFNYYWDITWGGHLHILHPQNTSLSLLTIAPTINYSVITLAKKDAWHKVGKVQDHAKQPRLVMGLQFYSTFPF